MIKRYLGNYKTFKCIADKCPDTCCSGWAIEIDEESYDRYEKLIAGKKEQGKILENKIDWKESCFKQQPNGDCAFLRQDGLCQMQKSLGEEMLCMTCDLYPRHMEEFPEVREYSLSVSCPEVAKELLKQKDKLIIIVEEEKGEKEEYDDFNALLYEKLLTCRKIIFTILQNREWTFETRANAVLEMMSSVQDQIDEGELESCDEKLETFLDDFSESKKRTIHKETKESWMLEQSNFELLFELEPLRKSFREFLKVAKKTLFEKSREELLELQKQFEDLHPDWEIWCEQLSVYFIYTYFCGAVYDDYVFSMAAQAVYNTAMIKLLWIAKWIMKTEPITSEEAATIVYQYSRELEHSNENMILLEQLLDSNGST